jgi:uncharacterized protein YegP (UPF0339 family)
MNEYQFECFDRLTLRGRRWFFRFVASNAEPMFQSEAYNSSAARDHAVEVIKREAGAAAVAYVVD